MLIGWENGDAIRFRQVFIGQTISNLFIGENVRTTEKIHSVMALIFIGEKRPFKVVEGAVARRG